jgi:FlaA1/EpsC-like NDP-sugar epimerase
VAEVWESIPTPAVLPVTDCERMWMTADEAVKLLTDALAWPSGRYALKPRKALPMTAVCANKYPDRIQRDVPLRRGDRPVERLVAEYETVAQWQPGIVRIFHPADQPVNVPLEATT